MPGTSKKLKSSAPQALSSRKTELVRERILAAARQHFFRYGFARFTMDDLAAELGMSKKTIYVHFRGKEELIDALISAKMTHVLAGVDTILARSGAGFSERATELFRHVIAELGEVSQVFLRDLSRLVPEAYEKLEKVRRENIPRIWKKLLEEGISAGAVRADLDTTFAANFMLLAIQALLHPDNLGQFKMTPGEAMKRIFDLTFAGMLTSKGLKDYEKNRVSFDSLHTNP